MVPAMQCPICGGALAEGKPIDVCAACHKSLVGGMAVRATGEFLVPTPDALAAAEAGDSPFGEASRPLARPANACAWCGKDESQVKKLLGRGGVALCNECVSLCVDILDAELGTWR
jgi:hypothetical protein